MIDFPDSLHSTNAPHTTLSLLRTFVLPQLTYLHHVFTHTAMFELVGMRTKQSQITKEVDRIQGLLTSAQLGIK